MLPGAAPIQRQPVEAGRQVAKRCRDRVQLGADEFLGTQGDVWDTQWDMFLAFLGAISAQLLLAKMHLYQMRQMNVYID